MRTIDPKPSPALGFLTVVEYPEHGLIGGYLVLNRAGRPLEFHCTAPSQAQPGPADPLRPHAGALSVWRANRPRPAEQATAEPAVICTDREPALAVREFVEVPVALVIPDGTRSGSRDPIRLGRLNDPGALAAEGRVYRLDSPHPSRAGPPVFRLGRNCLAVSPLAAGDRELIASRLGDLAETFDLAEPFQRIREAIEEARRRRAVRRGRVTGGEAVGGRQSGSMRTTDCLRATAYSRYCLLPTASLPRRHRRDRLDLEARAIATGWHRAIHRPTEIPVRRLLTEGWTPRVISVAIGHLEIATRSFCFNEPATVGETAGPRTSEVLETPEVSLATRPAAAGRTRIRPPEDVIKLEDRLRYVLQPSLESLLAERSLGFPLRPFPYQFEGVAFLYPRQAAILADEMGLGKTMQAITAIRLLLHRGEVRSVLLVCPKPLVTNWQREFSLWAPEMPVMVIEGDQARRRWQWQLPDVPVRIANYELLHRDRGLLETGGGDGPAARSSTWSCSTSRSGSRTARAPPARSVRALSRSRSWALTGTPVENSPEDLVGIFEFLAPGLLSPDDEAPPHGPHDPRLRPAADQGAGAHRPAAQAVPRRGAGSDAGAARNATGWPRTKGVLRLTELGDVGHDPARLRAGAAAEADLQFRPGHRRQREAGAARGRPGRGRRQRPQGDRLQPVGRARSSGSAEHLRRFRPLEYHGQVPAGPARRGRSGASATTRTPARAADELRGGRRGPEPPVRQLRVPLRPLVEPGRRGPGHQPRPPHRRRRAGHRHPLPHARHDRGADRPHPAGEARAVRHDLLRRRRAAASSA